MACLNCPESLRATDRAKSQVASVGRANAWKKAEVTVWWGFPSNGQQRTGTFHDGPHALSSLHVMAKLACHIFSILILP